VRSPAEQIRRATAKAGKKDRPGGSRRGGKSVRTRTAQKIVATEQEEAAAE